jgi:1-acyl-sn-glycerol-3-phosphate acyltransferase
MQYLRSLIYAIGLIPLTIFFVILSLLIYLLPFQQRFKIVSGWARCNLYWLKLTCGLTHHVQGLDNIPQGPAIIMCNHQSAWETMALQLVFPPHVWVLKKELLWIPLFGWGLATLKPIAINRSAGREALKQVAEQGKDRLNRGCWVVIFPEGTRIPFGETRRYAKSGGMLAARTGRMMVPVAHNAGYFWPKNGFLKKPGVIDLVIGPPIDPEGKSAAEITEEARQWIEPTVASISEPLHGEA